jgi:putative membrane protein insertion efficiency factor
VIVMKAWALAHPFLAGAALLCLEALLPVRFQPTSWACRGAIRLYQMTLSSHVPTQCKFTPTCSHYGLASIRRYGTLRGGILTTWRLIRCSPLTRGGVDPVPGDPAPPELQGS